VVPLLCLGGDTYFFRLVFPRPPHRRSLPVFWRWLCLSCKCLHPSPPTRPCLRFTKDRSSFQRNTFFFFLSGPPATPHSSNHTFSPFPRFFLNRSLSSGANEPCSRLVGLSSPLFPPFPLVRRPLLSLYNLVPPLTDGLFPTAWVDGVPPCSPQKNSSVCPPSPGRSSSRFPHWTTSPGSHKSFGAFGVVLPVPL